MLLANESEMDGKSNHKRQQQQQSANFQSHSQQKQQQQQLKGAAMAQANSQSLGNFKLNEKETNYGNFLIPILPKI